MAAASIVIDLIAKVGGFTTDTARAERSLKSLQKQIGDTRRVSEGFGDSFGNVGRELKSLAAIGVGSFGVASLAQAADSYTKFTAQLRLATNDAQAFQSAYNEVIRIASQSQSDIEAVGTLYARLSRNLKDVGITSAQLSDTTESVALALRVSGATAKETASVLLQLSQAFGAGRLNGQEFAAVAETAPVLLQQLAKSLGVPIGALKDLAAEGKLTRQELLKAFTNPEFLNSLRSQVKEVQTISSSVTELGNRFTIFIGEQDKASGASKALASSILFLAENLNALATGALVLVTAQVGKYIGNKFALITAISQTIAAEQAELASKQRLLVAEVAVARARFSTITGIEVQNIALANNAQLTTLAASRKVQLLQAETALAAATAASTASVTLFSRAIGFLGGPLGAIITTLGIGALAFFSFGDSAKKTASDLDIASTALEKYNQLRAQNRQAQSGNPLLEDLDKAAKQYADTLAKIGTVDVSTGVVFTKDNPAIADAKRQLDEVTVLFNKAQIEIGKPIQPVVDTTAFDALNSKLKTARNITDEYRKSVSEYLKEGFKAGISQEILKEGLVVLEEQYKKDIESLDKKTGSTKKATDEIGKFITSLERQYATFGLADEALLEYEASLLKLDKGQKSYTQTLIDGLRVKRQNKEADDEAKRINEEALTPLEKLTAEYDKLVKLQSSGLTEQGFNKGLKDAVSEFENASAGALSYGNVLDELNGLYEEATKAGFDVKNVSLELTIAYNQLFEELKNGTIAKDEYIRKSQELLKVATDEAKRISELSQILSQTDTAQLEEQRRKIKLLYEEYAKGTNEAIDSVEELGEAVRVVLGQQNTEVENSTNIMETLFRRAARNAQDAFADFLFDPFKDGLDGMLLNFVNVLRRMAAEALAAEIFKSFQIDQVFNGEKGIGGVVGDIFGGIGKIFTGSSEQNDSTQNGEVRLDESDSSSFIDTVSKIFKPATNLLGSIFDLNKQEVEKLKEPAIGSTRGNPLYVIDLVSEQQQLQQASASAFSIKDLFGGAGGGASFGGGGSMFAGFASGGFVSGKGTGTSDDIPIMVSNGEYVMTADKTRKYFGILEAMRNGTFSPKGFATGGIVQMDGLSYNFPTPNFTKESLDILRNSAIIQRDAAVQSGRNSEQIGMALGKLTPILSLIAGPLGGVVGQGASLYYGQKRAGEFLTEARNSKQLEESAGRAMMEFFPPEISRNINSASESLGRFNDNVNTSDSSLTSAANSLSSFNSNVSSAPYEDALNSIYDVVNQWTFGLLDVFKNLFNSLDSLLSNLSGAFLGGSSGSFVEDIFGGGGLFNSLFGGLGSFFGGGFANGGNVLSNRSYLVGERGPEMFVPRTNGTIVPNSQTMNTTANVSVKNINVLDPSIVGDYLRTDEGEKLIINTMQRNRYAYQ